MFSDVKGTLETTMRTALLSSLSQHSVIDSAKSQQSPLWDSRTWYKITVTARCVVCLRLLSGVSSLHTMSLRGYAILGVPSTSLLRSSASIGCVSLSAFALNYQFKHIEPFTSHLPHSCGRHAVTTTTAFVLLWSHERPARPFFYSRQWHLPGFWRCTLERPAGSCHICTIAGGFQTAL